jgi:hypothetical protein
MAKDVRVGRHFRIGRAVVPASVPPVLPPGWVPKDYEETMRRAQYIMPTATVERIQNARELGIIPEDHANALLTRIRNIAMYVAGDVAGWEDTLYKPMLRVLDPTERHMLVDAVAEIRENDRLYHLGE